MNIMLIDDDMDCVESLSRFIKRVGYECEIFSSPRKAIEAYAVRSYNIVITDLKMPELNGYQVLKRLLSLDPKAKVIIISGYGGNKTACLAINYGAHAFITKPLNLVNLMETIRDIASA